MTPPKIDNAPGLTWRPNKAGFEARWRARTDLANRGFAPKVVRLWCATLAHPEITEVQIRHIQSQCQILQREMLAFSRGGLPALSTFDGRVESLVRCYQQDKDSTYRKLRYRTRENYDHLCKRLVEDHGNDLLADIKARNLLRWYEDWSQDGQKVAMGHSMMGIFRTLCGFGTTILENDECARLCVVMNKMRFKMAPARKERLTAEQAVAIRAKAHAIGRSSIAIAQAFQFELMLRQKDVIGEWVPMSEAGPPSEIITGNDKWIRGLRWEEIDERLILRHTTSKRGKDIEIDLKLAPMVMEELRRLPTIPTNGPIVVCEANGVPWTNYEFRRWWRKIARECGIPDEVKNMDSRAGGISEATDAGADLEHVRHAATHSNIQMTQRYSRGQVEKVANVMQLRSAFRTKNS